MSAQTFYVVGHIVPVSPAWATVMTDKVMADKIFDIFIVGGGINGCGIARDAAGRGYSVYLAEQNDLASGTSSAATKLIHGGLRYLEHYEFRLVREALKEREILWALAPHIIWPLRFVLPYRDGLRPAWLIRLGLFLYDYIGGRNRLPPTKDLDLRKDPAGQPLKPGFEKGFEYSDCWANDARLVVLNAMSAAEKGAEIHTRTKVIKAERQGDHWAIQTQTADGETQTIKAKMLINAAGPWVDHVLHSALGRAHPGNVRLVQGSHIVVAKKYDDPRAYFFQNPDGRIFFAIPYEEDYTLIGTTDHEYEADPANVKISPEETAYLCAAASEYFAEPVTENDIIWSYSGVRPLYDDGASKAQEATRDYVLKRAEESGAPLLNIFGGKLTTYRRLAESALDHIGDAIGKKGREWTASESLPGGDFEVTGFDARLAGLSRDFPFLTTEHAKRLLRLYGTKAWDILGNSRSLDDLGPHFGADLYGAEITYLMQHEWARTPDDVLWRRTKRGLRGDEINLDALAKFIAGNAPE